MSNIIQITNFNDPQLDVYARLNEKQLARYYEPAEGLFIAESPNVILFLFRRFLYSISPQSLTSPKHA